MTLYYNHKNIIIHIQLLFTYLNIFKLNHRHSFVFFDKLNSAFCTNYLFIIMLNTSNILNTTIQIWYLSDLIHSHVTKSIDIIYHFYY